LTAAELDRIEDLFRISEPAIQRGPVNPLLLEQAIAIGRRLIVDLREVTQERDALRLQVKSMGEFCDEAIKERDALRLDAQELPRLQALVVQLTKQRDEAEGDLAEQRSAYASLLEQHQAELVLNKRLAARVAELEEAARLRDEALAGSV